MKKVLLLFAILFSLGACKKSVTSLSNNSIVGKWQLSESLADPGDGSGTWQPADSMNPSFLEFKANGMLNASPFNIYSADHYQVTSDSTIILIRGSEKFNRWYHLDENSLSLMGGCIEACGERYIPAP